MTPKYPEDFIVVWNGTEKDISGTIGGFGITYASLSTWEVLERYLRLWRVPGKAPRDERES